MNVFPFVEAEKAEQQGNVAKACELLEVSRSAYYCWSKHVPSRRQLADEELGERIEEIHAGSRGTYGWPRVHQQLRREAIHCSGKRGWVRCGLRRRRGGQPVRDGCGSSGVTTRRLE